MRLRPAVVSSGSKRRKKNWEDASLASSSDLAIATVPNKKKIIIIINLKKNKNWEDASLASSSDLAIATVPN